MNQMYAQQQILLPQETGTLIVLETDYFHKRGTLISNTVIMKKGNKIRVEETIPVTTQQRKGIHSSGEVKRIIISDGKSTWFILSNGRVERQSTPITHPLGLDIYCKCEKTGSKILHGRVVDVIETRKGKYYLDPISRIPLKREKGCLTTFYKSYELIEGVGYLPRVIETYNGRNLVIKTTVKKVEHYKMFVEALFDPHKVTFTKSKKYMNEEQFLTR